MTSAEDRTKPNILITGTPGVGKTATAIILAEKLNLHHANIGSIIQENKCHQEYDSTLDTQVLDEDKLLDILEKDFDDDMSSGGIIADYHACELFPERWFDLVICLRVETHVLYDRLVSRGYNEAKKNQNMECEIMRVVIDEAKQSYPEEIVQELRNNTIDEMDQNISRIEMWCKQWIEEHS